MSKDRISVT